MRAWNDAFGAAKYVGGTSGVGDQLVRVQVEAFIRGLDFTADIARIAKEELDSILRQSIRTAIAKQAKAVVREMKESGELFKEE